MLGTRMSNTHKNFDQNYSNRFWVMTQYKQVFFNYISKTYVKSLLDVKHVFGLAVEFLYETFLYGLNTYFNQN